MLRSIFLTLLFGLAAAAQSVNSQPQFDVASVKLVNHPVPPHGVSLIIEHGKLTVDAAQLRQIIGLAYGIQRVLVHGCPDWCDEDMFDIVAKTEKTDASNDEIRAMLRNLLAERFGLLAHRETTEVPGYELTVAKSGAKLEVAKADSGPINVFTPDANGLGFHNMSIRGLLNYLANISGRPVTDGTGLTERYHFRIEFRQDDGPPSAGPNAVPQAGDFAGMVFAAVERQLGLRVQARRVSTEILLVDQARHLTDN
jgi:uncharacterized protein (TIGR03435 family)